MQVESKEFIGAGGPWAIAITGAIARLHFCTCYPQRLEMPAKMNYVLVGDSDNIDMAWTQVEAMLPKLKREATIQMRVGGHDIGFHRTFLNGAAEGISKRVAELIYARTKHDAAIKARYEIADSVNREHAKAELTIGATLPKLKAKTGEGWEQGKKYGEQVQLDRSH